MKMNKPVLFALLFSILPVFCRAQVEKIEFVPPSAASLMKVADFPVNTNNGMPEIRIPLHEVSSGNLKLPLVLDFNIDSYFQPNQLPDSPGAGWSLSSDIQIARSINGEDDFGTMGYCSNDYIPAGYEDTPVDRDKDYLMRFYLYKFDEEPDKFYYRLLGKVGIFYFRRNTDGTATPVTIPANGVRIECVRTSGAPSFVVTDTDGTVYRFPDTLCEYEERSDGSNAPIQSWKCASIRNASQTDSIRFEYRSIDKYSVAGYTPTGIDVYDDYDGSPVHVRPYAYHVDYDHKQPVLLDFLYNPENYPGSTTTLESYPLGSLCAPPLYMIAHPKYSYNTVGRLSLSGSSRLFVYHGTQSDSFEYVHPQPQNTALLKKLYLHFPTAIRFRGGCVRFEYDERGPGVLQRIAVENSMGHTVKQIDFGQRYAFEYDSLQFEKEYRQYDRRLETLSVNGETYAFGYAHGHLGGVDVDFWGYSDNLSYPSLSGVDMQCFVPRHNIAISLGASALEIEDSRSPVRRLTIGSPLPDASAPSAEAFISIRYPTGGRVRFFTERHRYRDTAGAVHPAGGMRIARIDYYDAEGDTPVRRKIYRYGNDEDGCGIIKQDLNFNDTLGNCFTTQRLKYYYKADMNDGFGIIGSERKRTYLPYPIFSGDCGVGNWVCYSQVAEYDSEDGSVSGKRVYHYDVSALQYKLKMSEPRVAFPLEAHLWDIGMLDSVVDYKYIAPGEFRPVRNVSYTYREHCDPKKIYKGRVWLAELAVLADDEYTFNSNTTMEALHSKYSTFIYNYLGMPVGCMQTTSRTERIFEDDGSVRTLKTEYFYDNANCCYRPTRIRTEGWNGETTVRHTLYASDYNTADGIADTLSVMQRGNVMDKPVEEFVVRNGSVIEASLFGYDTDGDIIRSYRLKEPGMPVSRFRASNQPAAGTFSAASTTFNPDYSAYEPRTCVLYDAQKRPVELHETGQPPVCYVWAYDRCHPVAEVRNAVWSEVEPFASGLGAYPDDASLQSLFGQMRSAMPSAMVSGYIYRMLIGIAAAVDPSGRTTYYEYGDDNRLSGIRDEDGSLRRCFEYQVKHKE